MENAWRDRFAAIPFEDKGGTMVPYYYQEIASQKTLSAVADGIDRILLNLATGTGKTFIAFQIAWKLFQAKWNLTREPNRRPRILFLADRNILANQAFNAFSTFDEDARVRIEPDAITKKGSVPKNGSIFFTIFQTFMSGIDYNTGKPKPHFGDYPPDFFDFIIIDECHRGGAKDESSWRGILEYFSPAVQLGLTATPLRKHNADTKTTGTRWLRPHRPRAANHAKRATKNSQSDPGRREGSTVSAHGVDQLLGAGRNSAFDRTVSPATLRRSSGFFQ